MARRSVRPSAPGATSGCEGPRVPAAPARGGGPRAGCWDLAATLALAVITKSIVLHQLGGHPLLQPQGQLDGAHYVELARRVAAGGPLALGDAHHVSPLYVFFLAGVFATGGGLAEARMVQVFLGSSAVGLIVLTARLWYGRIAAPLAGLLAVFTGIFTFYEIVILQAALDPFLAAAVLYLVARVVVHPRWRTAVPAGLVTGLFVLNRPNVLPFVVVVAVGLPWLKAHRGTAIGARTDAPGLVTPQPAGGGRSWGPAVAFAAAALVVLVANGARNHATSGEFILIASHGGLNFYIGNHAGADGTYQVVPGITPSIAGQLRDAAREAEAEAGRRLEAGGVSRVFYTRAWRWMASEPLAAARLFLRKLALVFNHVNVPLNHSYAFYREEEPGLLRWLAVDAWLLVPLGLAGLLAAGLHRGRGFALWASFVPVYGVSVAAFFVADRYRLPLLVPLCVSAGGALAHALASLRVRDGRTLRDLAAVTCAAAVLAFWPLRVDEGIGTERTRKAVWLVEERRFDEARRYVELVAPSHSHPGVLHYQVADALVAAGAFEQALGHYEEALAIDGPRPAIRLALGQALVVAGRPADAIPHLAAALEAGPAPGIAGAWLVRALALAGHRARALAVLEALPDEVARLSPTSASDLGTLALQLDAPDRALRWWRLAAAGPHGTAHALEQLGATLLLLDRDAEAIDPLERACRLDPTSVGAHTNLALAWARLGQLERARAAARHAQQLAPGEPRVRDLTALLDRAPRAWGDPAHLPRGGAAPQP